MHDETRFSQCKPCDEKVFNTVNYYIDNGFTYYDGKCLFIGKIFSPWYTDETHASDFILYTRKEFRGEGIAKVAISKFIEWAKSKGATQITVSRSSGINEDSFKKMAEELKMKKIGEIYNV